MKIVKSNTLVIIILVLMLIFVQLLRMDILVSSDRSEYTINNEYVYADSVKLTENEKNRFTPKDYLILYDPRNNNDLENVKILCDYLKIDYKIQSSRETDYSYNKYKTIIMLEHLDDSYIDLSDIFDYVKKGGNLLYLGNGNGGDRDLLKKYNEEFGILDWYDIRETNYIYFNTEILLGLIGYYDLDNNDTEDYNNFQYLDVAVEDDVKVHLEDNTGSPLIWEKNLGEGKILVLNIGRYDNKETRGIMAGAFTLLEELFVYPVINSEVIFIYDFPADYKSDHAIIKKNYGRNFERFIKEIWWVDMLTLMKKYNLKYTSAYIQTYNDEVIGPFEYNKSTDTTTRQLARELIKHGGELSFHGYNHQSLLFNQESSDVYGYKAWTSEEKIVESINSALVNFNALFPDYKFYSYVPPSNLLDIRAIPALRKAIPTLKTISGLYFGEVDDFGRPIQDTMLQEIGVNENGLVDLPRLTSESFMHDNTKYRIASSVTLHGLVNHFLHPDDILDPDRSLNLLWSDLYKETERFFSTIDELYPWLESHTASAAAEKVKQVHFSRVFYDLKGNQIEIACDNFYEEISLVLVTNKEIVFGVNCHFEKIGLNRYLVKLYESKGFLEVK